MQMVQHSWLLRNRMPKTQNKPMPKSNSDNVLPLPFSLILQFPKIRVLTKLPKRFLGLEILDAMKTLLFGSHTEIILFLDHSGFLSFAWKVT